ncbi:M20 family metallopeptidase [Fodinicola acaciae]|uniref:M20 family metallopeptidase n=1 Tax=Fodinicola acaciae TaxID=2681555 RepID=UPI0013D2E365|nr:M20 family metallopeptidase [Fodinicola acaciae]
MTPPSTQRLDVQIPVDADGVVAFTRDLVRLRTVNEPGFGEAPAAGLVAAKMREFGWDPVVTEPAPGRPNVVATITGDGPGRTLLFEGHTDVVTEGSLDGWTVDPYGGEIRDGRLYGRGAADMKSGVAAMLYGVRALQLAGGFSGTVKVCALADEEGMMIGVHHLVDSGVVSDVDGAIVCEPEGGEICPVSKGAMRFRVTFTGTMAHGAMPQHARNPIPAAADFLRVLDHLQADFTARHGSHPHLGPTYVTPTVLNAGDLDQINVIPASATVAADIRTIPGVDHEELVVRLTDHAERIASERQLRASVTVPVNRPPVDTPVDALVVASLARAHAAVTGTEPVFGGVPGTTDGTILTVRAGIPTVVYGPGGKWIPHQADEFVELADIVSAARVYAVAAREFLSS